MCLSAMKNGQLISRSSASITRKEARVDVSTREIEQGRKKREREKEGGGSMQRENCRDTVDTPRLGDPQTVGRTPFYKSRPSSINNVEGS